MVVDDRAVRISRPPRRRRGRQAVGGARWFGAETISDPERNRFGGVLVSGVRTDDRDADNVGDSGDIAVNWFAQSADMTRLYLMGRVDVLRAHGVDRSFDALIAVAAVAMPEGSLDDVHAEGPIGFFANSDVWASRIAGDGIVLIGDAAGAADPTQGHGTSLLFRDVRELSALLLAERDWAVAIAEFEVRRRRYYDVIHGYDRWVSVFSYGQGDAADRAARAPARQAGGPEPRRLRSSRAADRMASWLTRPPAGSGSARISRRPLDGQLSSPGQAARIEPVVPSAAGFLRDAR